MTNRGMDIKNRKQRGEWAEMCFMARAAAHGLCVAKPYGDSARYDFAIEHQGRFLRVQLKSTKYMRFGSYICHSTFDGPVPQVRVRSLDANLGSLHLERKLA
jgi:hypothetical protein